MATEKTLRRGWSTGSCATACLLAARTAYIEGDVPARVDVPLPATASKQATFTVLDGGRRDDGGWACVKKDAGDDPDVTDGAIIRVRLRHASRGQGVTFVAGKGVGVVSRQGLPLLVGEAAINPVPRLMMLRALAAQRGAGAWRIEVGIDNGERLAEDTWNGRLGIIGGLSVLGTRGIVVPYSCSAWLHAIRQGIDVALAAGHRHLAAATGKTSEHVLRSQYDFETQAVLDMGDLLGGVIKGLAPRSFASLTLCGGFAKVSKIALGAQDLHVKRFPLDIASMLALLPRAHAEQVREAQSAAEVLERARLANIAVAPVIASKAAHRLATRLRRPVRVIIIDRVGTVVADNSTQP